MSTSTEYTVKDYKGGSKSWHLNGRHLAYSQWKQEVAKLNKAKQ